MARQLVLLDPPEHDWKLDDGTRTIGRRGLARARATLAALAAVGDPDTTPPAAA